MDQAIDNPPAGFTVLVEPNDTLVVKYKPTDRLSFPFVFLVGWFAMCIFFTWLALVVVTDSQGRMILFSVLGLFWPVGLFIFAWYVSTFWCRRSYRIGPQALEFERRYLFFRRRQILPWDQVREIHCITSRYHYSGLNLKAPPDDSILWLACGQRLVGRPTSSMPRPAEVWYARRVTLLSNQPPDKSDWLGRILAACSGMPVLAEQREVALHPHWG